MGLSFEDMFLNFGTMIVFCIFAITLFLFYMIIHIVSAIPVYKLAKKTNTDHAWLAWIPFIGRILRTYLICTMVEEGIEVKLFDGNFIMSEEKIPEFFNKTLTTKNRKLSFLIYVAGVMFLPTIVSALVVGFGVFPVIGTILSGLLSLLYVVPAIFEIAFNYVYLRDLMYIFNEDKKTCNIVSLIIAILDVALLLGLARTVYLYTLLKKQTVKSVLEIEAKSVEE